MFHDKLAPPSFPLPAWGGTLDFSNVTIAPFHARPPRSARRRRQYPEPPADAQTVIAASQESAEAPSQLTRQQLSGVHAAATPLLQELAKLDDGDQIAEIIATAIKLLQDDTNRGDIKLLTSSLKEIRYALKIFAPYREVRKVSIFGSARTPTTGADYISAAAMGKAMAEAGWMVITGAGGGIMAAAWRGRG